MVNHALRQKRLELGLTQQQFADASLMDIQTYSKKERGLRRITDREAVRFARILCCSVEEISTPDDRRE